MTQWQIVSNIGDIPSPCLLVYRERVLHNIELMIKIAGHVNRLRPHMKTHKSAEVLQMQMDNGIHKIKCATIAEAEMAASVGVRDILLAYQPIGPNMKRLMGLIKTFPKTKFSCLIDDADVAKRLSEILIEGDQRMSIYVDINCGMNRTGIKPDESAKELCLLINNLKGLDFSGLHVYDGHIRDESFEVRKQRSDDAFAPVYDLINKLKSENLKVQEIIAGGSPSFPVHAKHDDRTLSPGTVLFWDYGYSSKFSDLPFQHAAVLLTRVISILGPNLYCLDLGHKAVASEMSHPRVKFMDVDSYEMISHSEEHMVVSQNESNWKIGQEIYAVPTHICPTTALHQRVHVVENGLANDTWDIAARSRKITI